MDFWEWYQSRIAEFFRRVPGATVDEDVKIPTVNGRRSRQIDVHITMPIRVQLGNGIAVTIPLSIIVDAKAHRRRIDVGIVDKVAGLRQDVGAHLAIIASPQGFTSGAKDRAPEQHVFLLTATNDLLFMLSSDQIPEWQSCLFELCEPYAPVSWRVPSGPARYGTILGRCDLCNGLHVLCPDCGSIFALMEDEYGQPVKCPEECGRIFQVDVDFRSNTPSVERTVDGLDQTLLTLANGNSSGHISQNRVQKEIGKTKWQFFAEEHPTVNLTELEWMAWDEEGAWLHITEEGRRIVEELINSAEFPSMS